MQNILVPTDFSPNAQNALQYAIAIANHFEATIHLIHVYQVPSTTGMFLTAQDFMKKEVEQSLSDIVKSVKNALFQDTNLKAHAIVGTPVNIIKLFAQKSNADLIIMGTQGASGLKEIFFGSNTVGVINNGDTPVMAIPNNCVYHSMKNITLAIDTNKISDAAVIAPLVNIATTYKANIKLLHIEHKVEEIAVIDPGIDTSLSNIPHSFHLVGHDDIHEGIKKFVNENQTDLLCMVKRKRGFIGNLFHESVTQKEAFNAQVPLLVLYDG